MTIIDNDDDKPITKKELAEWTKKLTDQQTTAQTTLTNLTTELQTALSTGASKTELETIKADLAEARKELQTTLNELEALRQKSVEVDQHLQQNKKKQTPEPEPQPEPDKKKTKTRAENLRERWV